MRILGISVYYKPIRPGYGTRTPEIVLDSAARLGHEIVAYTGIVPDDMISDEKFRKRKHKEQIGAGSVEIRRLWIPTSGHHRPYRRSFIYIWFVIECFFKMLFDSKYDLVMGFLFPPFHIPLQILAKLRGYKFYMHQGDLFPDTVIDFNLTQSKFVIGLLRKTSVWSFNLADVIGVNNYATKVGMQKYPIDQDKVVYLELAIDTDVFRPVPVQRPAKFTVLYNGVFGPAYDFDLILDAAKRLQDHDDIQFIIAGKGESSQFIREGIERRQLKNVTMQEPVKEISSLVKRLNSCHVAVVCLVPADISKTPHPSKTFEYMACGRPVVCAGSGALEQLVNRSKGGFIVKSGDLDGFVNSILKLYNDRNLCDTMGANARRYIEENHSVPVYMKNLDGIIKDLFSSET